MLRVLDFEWSLRPSKGVQKTLKNIFKNTIRSYLTKSNHCAAIEPKTDY